MPETALQTPKTAAENALKKGDFSQLVHILLSCLSDHPNSPLLHNDLAKAYLKLGNRHVAKKHFITALTLDPHCIETVCQLALFHRQEGDFSESIRYFKKALRINPLAAGAHHQLGNTYAQQNQFDLAVTHYHEALQYGADSADIHRNLGMIYFDQNQWAQAAQHLNHAFSEAPDPLIGLPLGQALLNLGKPKDAEHIYETILQRDPDCHDAHHNLAILYLNAQDKVAAKHHFAVATALKPDNATAQHMTAALSENSRVTAPPLAYTKALFDQYAPYYDRHMQDLGYDLPLSIRNLLGTLIPTHAHDLTMLDLGCGTGRCGLYCRDLAHTLVGVDLSPNMLVTAKALGAYDKLCEASLQQYLETATDCFDIIIAAEVLNYLGDLSWLWASILKILKPGGWFIFTTEHPSLSSSNQTNNGCRLEHTGRFTHSPQYIQAQIERHTALCLQQCTDLTLRKSGEQRIMGRLWCIRIA